MTEEVDSKENEQIRKENEETSSGNLQTNQRKAPRDKQMTKSRERRK